MSRRSLTDRVETLEKTVDDLQKRTAQVNATEAGLTGLDVQFVQLRGELRVEFSAVREEIQRGDEETRRLREEMSTGFGELREEIRQGDEETRRFMRVLYEDLVARIAVLGERPH